MWIYASERLDKSIEAMGMWQRRKTRKSTLANLVHIIQNIQHRSWVEIASFVRQAAPD
jgi:hypothetical protein